MNSDIIAGNWEQLKGKIKQQWGKLTHVDVDGNVRLTYEQLRNNLQSSYGYAKQEAEKAIDAFLASEDLQALKHKAEALLNNSMQTLKQTTRELQDNLLAYVKENPVKSMAYGVVVGVLTAKLLSKN